MKKPQIVVDYDAKYQAYKDGKLPTKPYMGPKVIEYKKYNNFNYHLKKAVTGKDRKDNQKDRDALTIEMQWHIANTHNINNGVVFFASKTSQYYKIADKEIVYTGQAACSVSELTSYKLYRLMMLGRDANMYITSLDFVLDNSNNKRTSDLAFAAYSIQIDIDYYKIETLKNKDAKTVYKMICKFFKEKYNGKIEPSYSIVSGNGLYIILLINEIKIYDNNDNKRLYNQLVSKLIDDLAPFGADATGKDLSRVFRLVQTFNCKKDEKKLSYIIDFDLIKDKPIKRYDINDLLKILNVNVIDKPAQQKNISSRQTESKSKAKTKTKAPSTYKKGKKLTLNSLGQARVNDLMQWLHNRHYNVDKRHLFFLYIGVAYAEYNTPLDLHGFLIQTNKNLLEPLVDTEVQRLYIETLRSAMERNGLDLADINNYIDYNHYLPEDKTAKTYKYDRLVYKNTDIISMLEMTPNEIKNNKTIITEQEKNERKKVANKAMRRNANGLTAKQNDMQDKVYKIIAMIEEGKSQNDIINILKISKRTYYRYLKQIKAL